MPEFLLSDVCCVCVRCSGEKDSDSDDSAKDDPDKKKFANQLSGTRSVVSGAFVCSHTAHRQMRARCGQHTEPCSHAHKLNGRHTAMSPSVVIWRLAERD